jgi:betaine-aldehyde dehydrogenase
MGCARCKPLEKSDWCIQERRRSDAMSQDGAALQPPLRHPDKLFINGEWSPSSGTAEIEVVVPATEQVYMRVASATIADVDRAVDAARNAFDNGPWPRMTYAERADYLRRIGEDLDARRSDIGQIWPNEMGITHSLARIFSGGAGATYRSYAELADTFPFEKAHPTTAGAPVGLLVREAVGVVGIIIPWNGPIMSIAIKLAPALLAGCTAIIKASPEAPGHALLMAEVVEKIGLPPGVVNVVTADRDVSEALVRNPSVDKIAFTGSTAAGQRIASLLGGRMGRYTMELGGKSAAIVLDDYPVEKAAQNIATNVSRMSGQVCAALTRIIVPRSRHAALLDALAGAFDAIRVGDPFDPASQMGPVASARHRERVESYIASGKADGFTLAAGGGRPTGLPRGYFVEPTVFGGVSNDAMIAREEIFGPVACVIPVADERQAVEIANDSIYGLAGAIYTEDTDKAYAVARMMRTGTVGHNGLTADFGIAFGGFKQSGVGREGGVEGLLPYLETKTVLLHDQPRHRRDA